MTALPSPAPPPRAGAPRSPPAETPTSDRCHSSSAALRGREQRHSSLRDALKVTAGPDASPAPRLRPRGLTPTPCPTPLYVHPPPPLSHRRPPVQPRSLHTCPDPAQPPPPAPGRAGPGRATTVRPCRTAAGPGQASPRPAAGPAPAAAHLRPAGRSPGEPPAGPAPPPHGRSPAGSHRRRQHPSAAAILGPGRGHTGSAHTLPARSKEGGGGSAP
ncbi:translation initiation factor IF-2-like [Pyrgilauda ruficollis]|uniref:translation initiation factor IF-2-like n=1 Tax=Pyrgilauda ruficollis TaxID=221976 RepID=UPI001B87FFB1|nr:translation initiation factor IF-2-like [Pyrgilauda ruficollis]